MKLSKTSSIASRSAFLRAAAFTFCAATMTTPAFSQSAPGKVLMQGANVAITTDDVLADMQRMPSEIQYKLLASPDQMRVLVDNIYLRRATALQAEKNPAIAKDPVVQYKLQAARENVLAEALLLERDKETALSSDALDTYARVTYKAEPKRFEAPAEARASHILIQGKTPENLAKAEKLLADIKAGAKFEDLAKANSQDPGSAAKGGDLGWFAKGRMVKPFEDAVEALQKPGDMSGIVTTDFGYHIIRLDDRKPAGTRTFEEVREQLRAEAIGKMQKENRQKHVDALRANAKGDETALQAFIEAQKATRK